MNGDDYKKLFDQLSIKVRRMRGLQKRKDKVGNWFGSSDYQKLKRLEHEVDNMVLLDDQGRQVFLKNVNNEN